MTPSLRAVSIVLAGLALAAPAARGQDSSRTTIRLNGVYDPLRGKTSVAVLPISGAFGDSIRKIIKRDLDFSDRFTVVDVDSADADALRAAPGAGLNYTLFGRLGVQAVVQITPVATGLHVVLHDVQAARVAKVGELPLPASGLSRDWRLAVHRTSDEVEQWVTGRPGIAATRIAYMRGRAIRVVDSDGAAEITVPTDSEGVSPAWAPDAQSLAYATYGANSRIVIIDMATGRSRTIVGPGRNVGYSTPAFSPNGTMIVYTRSDENQSDLFAMPVASPERAQRLTSARGFVNSNPVFSPNGSQIAYVTNISGPPELYIMDADGTGAHKLTEYDFSERNYRSDPDWSPDGRVVAYQERINDRFQIRTIPISGGTPKLLTSEGENEQPAWAPDARHLVFTSNRTGTRQLWILDIESGRFRQLTTSGGSRMASWSPRVAGP